VTVDKASTQTLRMLHNHGFKERRTLLTLRKDFG
jgi:hypothetical protein